MKRFTVELRAEARKYVNVLANSSDEAMDMVAEDDDDGEWEIMDVSLVDCEEDCDNWRDQDES